MAMVEDVNAHTYRPRFGIDESGATIPTAQNAVADRTQRTGAVISRDPRLMRARNLRQLSKTVAGTSATQRIVATSEAMEVLSVEMGHH
jgi:hypothetical protein